MTRYEIGFMRKCAEYGVDTGVALALCKMASKDDDLGAVAGSLEGTIVGGGGGAIAGMMSSEKPFVKHLKDMSLHGVKDKELLELMEKELSRKTYKDLLENAVRDGSEYQFKKMHNTFRTARAGKFGAMGAAGGLTLGAILGRLLSKKDKGKAKKKFLGLNLG